MTTIPPVTPAGQWRRCLIWAMTMLLALTIGAGHAIAASPPAGKPARPGSDQGSWIRSSAIFLVISAVGGYAWYFGLFPRLLRKKVPSWPLDAWRLSSYGAWITTCLAVYAFRKPLVAQVVEPSLRGAPSALITYFMELILIPLLVLVGLLVIWNFRRDVTTRTRAG